MAFLWKHGIDFMFFITEINEGCIKGGEVLNLMPGLA